MRELPVFIYTSDMTNRSCTRPESKYPNNLYRGEAWDDLFVIKPHDFISSIPMSRLHVFSSPIFKTPRLYPATQQTWQSMYLAI
jgi:hypothetical protein